MIETAVHLLRARNRAADRALANGRPDWAHALRHRLHAARGAPASDVAVDPGRTAAAAVLPPDHPAVLPRRIGVLLSNLGTPGRDRLLVDAPLPRRVPVRPARHRGAAGALVADPQRHHPDHPARPQGQGLRHDLEPRAQREPAQDHHARPGREARGRRSRPACSGPRTPAASWSTGACATAIRRSAPRWSGCKAQGCDRILLVPLYPQYAAATTATACDKTFEALMTMRWQPALARGAALSRRPRLYRRAGALDPRGPGEARLRARGRSSPRSTACRRTTC